VGPRAVLDAVVKRKIPIPDVLKIKVKLSLSLTKYHTTNT
jgi:hypothetical protein